MTHKKPLVTALVPSYNHGKYIVERIESILKQTYENIELIVIDDKSTDDSIEIINELKDKYGFTFIQNKKNSGSPFSAWESVCKLANGEYIWICESDDVAETNFIEVALEQFHKCPEAVMFYASSNVIDNESKKIGHTDNYFHDIWKETRWDTDFKNDGLEELVHYQIRGQTVPNMSSAVFSSSAFIKSFSPFIKRFKLTGDWLFVGELMKQGEVIYTHQTLSNFRQHEVTSRVRVKSARSQAEYLHTKFRLFRGTKQPLSKLALFMSTDVVRFLYEPASWLDVMKETIKLSWLNSFKFGFLMFISICKNRDLIKHFRERYNHAKTF